MTEPNEDKGEEAQQSPQIEKSTSDDGTPQQDQIDSQDGTTLSESPAPAESDREKEEKDLGSQPFRPPPLLRRGTTDLMRHDQIQELQRIVTSYSRSQSFADRERTASTGFPHATEDPTLNPQSKEFDLEKCLRFFIKQMGAQGLTPERIGVLWKNVNVSGTGAASQVQRTVGDFLLSPLRIGELFSLNKRKHRHILHDFNGLLKSGELLVVLGRPGSGCSTLLKTICGEHYGLTVEDGSVIHYNGIPQKKMMKEFKGEVMYNQEVDTHFPQLTVGQTLEFAAAVRAPSHRNPGVTRKEFCKHVVEVVMAICGLTHTYNTRVGNEYIRGVSGGERKRVSIAEMILAGSPLSVWDNSTRGLDSATALSFVETLRLASDLAESANAVAIYQASQSIYDLFDKATVLYQGHQIYFGPARDAKAFFERQGWFCPPRQTTGDFLTSLTNPHERTPREGMENKVPRTPEDFEKYWRESPEFQALQSEMESYEKDFPVDDHGPSVAHMAEQKNFRQAKHMRPESSFIVSIPMQVKLNTKRAYQRVWNDVSPTVSMITMNIVLSLIFGSLFYGTPDATAGFSSKASVLFVAILLNALTAISEINSQYAQRPIVLKHASYAFYHPTTEAIASMLSIIPIKFMTACVFNSILYFLTGLRREPSQFFLYFLISFMCTLVMSSIFRTVAAMTKTVSQAMAIASVTVLALIVYTGFAIAVPQMHPWFSWIRWVNPIYYGFEILVANEFHGRDFTCSSIIPAYSPPIGESWICNSVGAVAGQPTVSGDDFISAKYGYYYSHVWRNFGILLAFLFFFLTTYFIAVNFSSNTSTGEVLVFRRGKVPPYLQQKGDQVVQEDVKPADSETTQAAENKLEPQTDIFTWKNVVFDIKLKGGETRRLLDNVSGWVKPGTLTALMGVSGAGKTTLLDVLAQRTTIGVVTGDMFVNGKPLDASFQRKTGYVQQQDLHMETATVRESLRFSAMLRQPKSVSKKEKYDFVEEVIKMLNMEEFADAVVGVPGEGLNVEQRKLLTIGVELAAKPKLLLFLDEPTSGLDSQSSWAICSFLRKITDAGQAILCTIHQPSALLFQEFDRLLFLARGGKTVYFGDIGHNSRTVLDYFEANGGRHCSDDENPAEYLLEVVNQGGNNQGEDWNSVWKNSLQSQAVLTEVDAIHAEKLREGKDTPATSESHEEFAMPFSTQLQYVTYRVFQQYFRMPNYIIPKWLLGLGAGLFIGFTFYHADNSEAGNENVIYSVFLVTTLFSNVVQQILPGFITRRSLYEVRERPSKAYSWKAFLLSSIIVEIPYQLVTSLLIFACFYYPVVGVQSSERQILILLFCCELFIYACSFAHMCVAAMPNPQTAAALVVLLNMMSVCFSGVLQPPSSLPGFWIFMYRVSPFTYWIGGIVATELHGRLVDCSSSETATFDPPNGTTCGKYMAQYLEYAPGQLQNPNATSQCHYCSITTADEFLESSEIYWSDRWRNFGIMWAYIIFNIVVAVLLYYVFRVKKWSVGGRKKKSKKA